MEWAGDVVAKLGTCWDERRAMGQGELAASEHGQQPVGGSRVTARRLTVEVDGSAFAAKMSKIEGAECRVVTASLDQHDNSSLALEASYGLLW